MNQLIQAFDDGVVIHHPDLSEPQMVCLDSKGAWLLMDGRGALPLTLFSLTRILKEWYEYNMNGETCLIAYIDNPKDRTDGPIFFYNESIQFNGGFHLTIPECAAILKEWFE